MWEKILTQIGLVLLMRWLSGDKDSSAIETKIFNTTDKDEMLKLIVGEVVADVIKDKELDPYSEKLISDLVATKGKLNLQDLVNKSETKASLADMIGNIFEAIFNLFGK